RVDEVRKGDGCLPTLAVPGMIEPDHPESSGQEWSNQAAHLQATTAPTVDQQRTRGVGRPRLPNCKGVLAYDNRFTPGVRGTILATCVARRRCKQTLCVTPRQLGQEPRRDGKVGSENGPRRFPKTNARAISRRCEYPAHVDPPLRVESSSHRSCGGD